MHDVDGDEVGRLLSRIDSTPGCRLLPAAGMPRIDGAHLLPRDLVEFYRRCGGVELFASALFPILVSPPTDLLGSNRVIVGAEFADDLSASWYVIASDGDGQRISIDLDPSRAGRCYDSFVDTHGVAGSCAVVATSFTDLLSRLVANQGEHWYWCRPDFVSLGDAYDATT